MVEDLLHLARRDAGVQAVKGDLIDLDDVARESITQVKPTGALLETDLASAVVRGSRDRYAEVVPNFLENAARHATARVGVTAAAGEGWAVLTVTDDGPGIPPRALEEVLERFVRLDESRTAGGGGAGLGLATARDTVERHKRSFQAHAGDGAGDTRPAAIRPRPRPGCIGSAVPLMRSPAPAGVGW